YTDLLKTTKMKKTVLAILFCAFVYSLQAQCPIDPFIQANYEFDAKLLVLREIQNNPNDPDYDNPFLTQSRVDDYLKELSAIYNNPQNLVDIDSLFNEFQFHVSPKSTQYKNMIFHVDTNASWVQSLRNTGTTGITAFDNVLSTYQFTVVSANDYTTPPWENKTIFTLESSLDFLNTYALRDDLQNATTEDLFFELTFFNSPLCSYNGIPYTIETYELPPNQIPVVDCNISKIPSSDHWTFSLYGGCLPPGLPDLRFVTVSTDCSTVTFSRTLSTVENELTDVRLYPNPASDFIQIEGVSTIKAVEMYTLDGKKIPASVAITSQVAVGHLKSGVYFLKVTDDQNRSIIKKFIKQ
ncbi:MAG: T9SS type A sorting domain-containing protein, partial [Bacteroidota bacterium]